MQICKNKSIMISNQTVYNEIVVDFIVYSKILIYIIGILTNSFCVLIFIKIIREEINGPSNMFRYFLIKSIIGLIYFTSQSLIHLREIHKLANTFMISLIWIIFQNYISLIARLASSFFEIAASLDCLLLIVRNFEAFIKKSTFYIVTTIIISYSCLFYVFSIFTYKICTLSSHNDTFLFSEEESDFYKTETYIIMSRLHTIQRDIINFVLLLIINILILKQLQKATIRRRNISSHGSSLASIASNAEVKKMKMILLICLIYSLHFPSILYHFNVFFLDINDFNSDIIVLLLDLTSTLSIVPYLLYNNTFKRSFQNIFSYFC
jgi:hypothetical protein